MPETTILVVDPDQTVLSFLRRASISAGHLFCGSRRGGDALRKAREIQPDVAAVRMGLPDMSGREIVSRLRAEAPRASILVTAWKGEEEEIAAGLELGAVNFLTFPFGDEEFLARVGTLLRWARQPRREGVLDLGPVSVDLARARVVRPFEQALTGSEVEILRRLLNPPGRAVTRRQLPVGNERAVDVHVASLRSKLGEAGECIETLRGIGYRFRMASCP